MYEIAKLKSEDERWQMVDLKDICERVIDEAYTIGVHVSERLSFGAKFEMEIALLLTRFPQVVDDLTPESYAEFLKERAVVVEEQKALLQAQREAKLLRTAA